VHSEDCPNVKNLLYDHGRRIEVSWAGDNRASYAIELEVVAEDRAGLLADVTQSIAEEGSNIRRIAARAGEDGMGHVAVSLEARDRKHLEKILSGIRAVTGVREVIRRYNVPRVERE
jgi:GTP pyrophosphokinase